MLNEYVYAPGFLVPLVFNPAADTLGSGTVGEVFRVTPDVHETSTLAETKEEENPTRFALKRFFNRAGRDDFENERGILKALSTVPHAHIVSCLSSWTSQEASYMLFPLAKGDLYHFIRHTPSPKLTTRLAIWLLEQLSGLCDTVSYLHGYESPLTSSRDDAQSLMHRIGFHHDLKPANILLYSTASTELEPEKAIWKIGDFGSGTTKYVSSSSRESIYNRKASTGDPIYSAPEYLVEGRVSRPKDIWSLGCIFLEVLIWTLDPSRDDAINQFEQARKEFSQDSTDQEATYWCQGRDNGLPYLNPAVAHELDAVEMRCKTENTTCFGAVVETVRAMLTLSPTARPTAAEVCERLRGTLGELRSRYPG